MSKEANLDDWFKKFVVRQQERDLKKQELISNTKYIDWLVKFTTEYEHFYDDDWLYFPEKITVEDNKFVNDLSIFYNAILTYADKNCICPTPCNSGSYYNIKYNNVGLEIGIKTGQGSMMFCKRKEIDEETEFIDFNDIMNNKSQSNIKAIENDLNNLSKMINLLYKKGIPAEIIEKVVSEEIDCLNKIKENSNVRVLKK